MENSLLEILTYYVIGGALLIGAPEIILLHCIPTRPSKY